MTLPAGYALRPATPADAELIQGQRDALFTDMGRDPEQIRTVAAASLAWMREALAAERYQGWLVQDLKTGETVAGAGATWQDLQPNPTSKVASRAYIDNVYVVPQARRQGLARHLVRQLISDAQRRGVRLITLHASDDGRPVYEALGFAPTTEMFVLLPVANGEPE
jgi:ribosomal protein S18 acetylase RimI-like enzyme